LGSRSSSACCATQDDHGCRQSSSHLRCFDFIAGQIGAEPTALADYAQRDETRREYQQELLTAFGWKTIDRLTYRVLARWLVEIAWGVDQSVSLMRELLGVGELRRRRILMPSMAEDFVRLNLPVA